MKIESRLLVSCSKSFVINKIGKIIDGKIICKKIRISVMPVKHSVMIEPISDSSLIVS